MGEIKYCPLCNKPSGEKAYMGLMLCDVCHSSPDVHVRMGELAKNGHFLSLLKSEMKKNATAR